MALDEALLDEAAAGRSLPTVRCFTWRSPCITVGRFQSVADLDLSRCTEVRLAVVRRPSGGAAVLHGADLGYAIVLPPGSTRDIGGPAGLYQAAGEAMASALRSVGLPAETRSGQVARPAGACFASLGPCEVVVDGLKVAGSAQLRRRGAILQHGSLYPDGGAADIARYLAGSGWSMTTSGDGTSNWTLAGGREERTLSALLARRRAQDLANRLRGALGDSLGIEFVDGGVTAAEQGRARALVRAKYLDSAWNLAR